MAYGRDDQHATMRHLGYTGMVEPKRVSCGSAALGRNCQWEGDHCTKFASRRYCREHATTSGADAGLQAGSMSDESAQERLLPFPQRLDADGRLHDIAPEHERLRLFEPAPDHLPGQAWLELDGNA